MVLVVGGGEARRPARGAQLGSHAMAVTLCRMLGSVVVVVEVVVEAVVEVVVRPARGARAPWQSPGIGRGRRRSPQGPPRA